MTLPVPPKAYVGSTYHAGNYAPIPDWDECLAAVNGAVVPIVEAYGGSILDLTTARCMTSAAPRLHSLTSGISRNHFMHVSLRRWITRCVLCWG